MPYGYGNSGGCGTPGLAWKGAWDAQATYAKGDAVSCNGSSYVSNADGNQCYPPDLSENWDLLAGKGEIGSPGLVWKGEYDNGYTYGCGDVVSCSGASYVAIGYVDGDPPEEHPELWQKVADKGAAGDPGQGFAVGDIKWQAHGTAETGWLECDGAKLKKDDYPDLYAKIGDAFNDGSQGSDEFMLPNLPDRVALSRSGSRSIGACGGEEEHQLSTDEMPSHDHGGGEVNGCVDVSGDISGQAVYEVSTYCVCDSDPSPSVISCIGGCEGYCNTLPVCGTFSGGGSFCASFQTCSCGGSQAHNNMQPYLVLMAVIKVAA